MKYEYSYLPYPQENTSLSKTYRSVFNLLNVLNLIQKEEQININEPVSYWTYLQKFEKKISYYSQIINLLDCELSTLSHLSKLLLQLFKDMGDLIEYLESLSCNSLTQRIILLKEKTKEISEKSIDGSNESVYFYYNLGNNYN